jgi:hypothetical protein
MARRDEALGVLIAAGADPEDVDAGGQVMT